MILAAESMMFKKTDQKKTHSLEKSALSFSDCQESKHFLGHLIEISLIVSETWILLLFPLWWKISYLLPPDINSACEEEAAEVQACLGDDGSHTAPFISE